MDEKRLAAFEKMLKSILSQYDSTVEKMVKLKADDKEKTVTYRQLFASKTHLLKVSNCYGGMGFWSKKIKSVFWRSEAGE